MLLMLPVRRCRRLPLAALTDIPDIADADAIS